MSERSPEILVQDILDSIHSIRMYTDGMSVQSFLEDPKTRDADYFGIDYEIVWDIIQESLENLVGQIQQIARNH